MAVDHVTSVAAAAPANPTTSCTITVPNNVVNGYTLYVQAISRDHTSASALLTISDNDIGGNTWTNATTSADRKAYLWYKYATLTTVSTTITMSTAVGSLAAGLAVYSGVHTSVPFTNLSQTLNLPGDETHGGFTPSNASSMICLGVYNYSNDNTVTTQATASNPGALLERWERLSTGGSDCACVHASNPQVTDAAATGDFTWAQTNGSTHSIVWAIPPEFVAPPAGADYIRFANNLKGLGSGLMAAGSRMEFYSLPTENDALFV